ncbi:hypothetical protein, partial [Salmonella sp. s51933]|uniref:hypothetical protein n=1 Tax=Salmonella sp. s51933 TaxID=3160127 RepID=UPI0037545722
MLQQVLELLIRPFPSIIEAKQNFIMFVPSILIYRFLISHVQSSINVFTGGGVQGKIIPSNIGTTCVANCEGLKLLLYGKSILLSRVGNFTKR